MKIYIRGIGNISPQRTFDNDEFLDEVVNHEGNRLNLVAPPYKEILNPRLMRRMSKIIKMGVAAAKICLDESEIEMPDAIIIGTAMGCVKDTETFLKAYGPEESSLITPTAFIRSTHNTVGGQIALLLKCNQYNFTYVHRGFSFESAVLDGILKLKEGEGNHILVGGVDEMTDNSYLIKGHLGKLKPELQNSLDLFNTKSPGISAGEGSIFFLLSNQENEKNYAELSGLFMVYKPKSQTEIQMALQHVLKPKDLELKDIDAIIIGKNGDQDQDALYDEFLQEIQIDVPVLGYKHLCGEYETSSAFALWLAAKVIKEQNIPKSTIIKNIDKNSGMKHVLIYNHYRSVNHSFYLVSTCS